jgi:hypothetical protein
MKRIILLVFTLCSALSLYAQQNEIDRLCAKYKHDSTYVIYATDDEIQVKADISKNPDGKPQEISLYGEVGHTSGIADIIMKLFNQKKQQGYKVDADPYDFPNYINLKKSDMTNNFIYLSSDFNHNHFTITMIKGSLYFTATITCWHTETRESNSLIFPGLKSKQEYFGYKEPSKNINEFVFISNTYRFSLTNGDNNRKGGKKAKTFDF